MGAAILLLAFAGIGLLRPVEDVSYTVLSPIETLLRGMAQPVANVVSRYGDTRALAQENEALRTENERLTAEVARLHEDTAQLDQLQGLLGTRNALPNQQVLLASVVATDPTNGRRRVAINKGRADGIKVGNPVVTEGSTLVGTITEVDDDHAWVTLVTDIDSAVATHIVESRAQGIVEGRYDGTMRMTFVDQNAAVKEGDRVMTSGLGGTYPEGLVVGKVTSVSGSPQELFKSITVAPLASLSNLENLLVITSFVPTELAPP